MARVAVIGAAGYAGVEAVRWVLGHPRLELALATSSSDAGRPLSELYPALRGRTDVVLEVPDVARIVASADVAMLAVPHTASLGLTPALLDAGVTVIDLSADYRLKDPGVYAAWYGAEHTSQELLAEAVYGLPEIGRDRFAGARLVACPGCYPTATALAAIPALEAGVCAGTRIVVDAKSGVSGAGRQASTTSHFCSANEAVSPYKVGVHRHTPEMEQVLSDAAGSPVSVLFSPHLVPMTRGLLSTVYMDVAPGFTTEDALAVYRERFSVEPFVDVLPAGHWPSTAQVRGSNRAMIGLSVVESADTLVVACAIDNLGKGAAGQAVQCLNLVLGFDETEGLSVPEAVV